jgi:hypothetical protein
MKQGRTFESLKRYTVAAWLPLASFLVALMQYRSLSFELDMLMPSYDGFASAMLTLVQIEIIIIAITFIARLLLLKNRKIYYNAAVVCAFAANVVLALIQYSIMNSYIFISAGEYIGEFIGYSIVDIFWLWFLNPGRLMKIYPPTAAEGGERIEYAQTPPDKAAISTAAAGEAPAEYLSTPDTVTDGALTGNISADGAPLHAKVFCAYCGKELSTGALFCYACGRAVTP